VLIRQAAETDQARRLFEADTPTAAMSRPRTGPDPAPPPEAPLGGGFGPRITNEYLIALPKMAVVGPIDVLLSILEIASLDWCVAAKFQRPVCGYGRGNRFWFLGHDCRSDPEPGL
jgi:hypothetical protein